MLALHSTNLLDFKLKDRLTGNPVAGATVIGQIRNPLGALLIIEEPSTKTFTMDELESTPGTYRFELPVSVAEQLVRDNVYRLEVTSHDTDDQILVDVERLLALDA